MAELLKAAEHGGPYRFIARVAFSRTLHGMSGVGPMPAPRVQKSDRWKARRKLAAPVPGNPPTLKVKREELLHFSISMD